ncbi:hypothetical protein LTR09_006384 [Extremus antarcticus]|uniref:Uncharacterized protein n=1 Tax=Extremus antarcticus TaxID=702011 RepID=A0AAJ0GBT9_9PEZI|nr:hypothetical protein LTR09_006384 [Extremus antarcticus]
MLLHYRRNLKSRGSTTNTYLTYLQNTDLTPIATMASTPPPSGNNNYGFLNPRHATPRVQKIKWDAENDVKLLLYGLGREISPKEYEAIAASFPEKPTPKSVQERVAKLRREQKQMIREAEKADEGSDAGQDTGSEEDVVKDEDGEEEQ